MKDFFEFLRTQGVVGLAVGFILGGAVSKLVGALVDDLINPILGIALGAAKELKAAVIKIGPAEIKWGDFINVAIDFAVISCVVYFGVKGLGLDKLDVKKQ